MVPLQGVTHSQLTQLPALCVHVAQSGCAPAQLWDAGLCPTQGCWWSMSLGCPGQVEAGIGEGISGPRWDTAFL